VSSHVEQIDYPRLDIMLINIRSILMLRQIAFSLAQKVEEAWFQGAAEQLVGQLDGTGCVLDYLNGFNAGNIIKKTSRNWYT